MSVAVNHSGSPSGRAQHFSGSEVLRIERLGDSLERTAAGRLALGRLRFQETLVRLLRLRSIRILGRTKPAVTSERAYDMTGLDCL